MACVCACSCSACLAGVLASAALTQAGMNMGRAWARSTRDPPLPAESPYGPGSELTTEDARCPHCGTFKDPMEYLHPTIWEKVQRFFDPADDVPGPTH